MRDVVVIGAGKIGAVISDFLARSGDYRVTVIDGSAQALEKLETSVPLKVRQLDVSDTDALVPALSGAFAMVSAAPFWLVTRMAEAAKAAGAHYLDITEDVAATRQVQALAEGARTAFVPQCGLAPGFIGMVAAHLCKRFDDLHEIRMRVGALPRYPSNALSYNLTWSTDGLINEYSEPCDAIVNGERRWAPPMEELEEFSLDGVAYEAFNTSGGLGSLCELMQGRVRTLNYKTIRYPGHAHIMKALLKDLRLRERREVLKDILENALPATLQDVVIALVSASGLKAGRLMQETYVRKVYSQEIGGVVRSAIQVTTAAGVCGVLDLLAEGLAPQSGFVRQEEIPLERFLANRFGRLYGGADAAPAAGAPESRRPMAAMAGA